MTCTAHSMPDWLHDAHRVLPGYVRKTPEGWESEGISMTTLGGRHDGVRLTYGRWRVIVRRAEPDRHVVTVWTEPGKDHGSSVGHSLAYAVAVALGRAPKMPEPLVHAVAHVGAWGVKS